MIAFPRKIGATSKAKKQTEEIFQFNLKIRTTIYLATSKRRKNIVTKKSDQSEGEQATDEEKKDLPKFVPSTDRDKANTSVSQMSNFENSTTHVLAKEVNSEFAQTFPFSHSPMTRNEFTGSFKRITSSPCLTCRSLSCRPTSKDVDKIDCHCR